MSYSVDEILALFSEPRNAAAKLSPESVDFGAALGLSRCGLCAHFQPSDDNAMTGTCRIVDRYRVERNNWCEKFTQPDPDTFGRQGGTVALTPERFLAMVTGVPSPALLARNAQLVARVRMHRASMARKFGAEAPEIFAGWLDGS